MGQSPSRTFKIGTRSKCPYPPQLDGQEGEHCVPELISRKRGHVSSRRPDCFCLSPSEYGCIHNPDASISGALLEGRIEI